MTIPDHSSAAVHLDLGRALDMLGDEQEVREILQLAEASLGENIPKARELVRAGRTADAAALLHVFKGMLPVFCGDALIAQVTVVERMARTAAPGTDLPGYPEVEAKLEQLLSEIRKYLGAAGARP